MAQERNPETGQKQNDSKEQTMTAEASTGHDAVAVDRLRWSFEDPMHNYLKEQEKREKLNRVKELQMLLDADTSTDSSDDSSSGRRSKRKRSSDRKNRKRHKSDKKRKSEKRDSDILDSNERQSKHKHKKWKEKKSHKTKKHKYKHSH